METTNRVEEMFMDSDKKNYICAPCFSFFYINVDNLYE